MYIQSLMVSKLQESMEWHSSYSTLDINISLTTSITDKANKFGLNDAIGSSQAGCWGWACTKHKNTWAGIQISKTPIIWAPILSVKLLSRTHTLDKQKKHEATYAKHYTVLIMKAF